MEDRLSLALRSQLQAQEGVVSRQQALDAGFTVKAITCRLRSGAWQRLSRKIHVSVPITQHPGRHRELRGIVIHRSRNLVAEWQPPWQLPRTMVADTVLDLVATARTFDDAYGWISVAVGRQLTTPELLGKALAARPRMRWRGWVAGALADAAEGVHAPLQLAGRHRAPLPDRRPDRRGPAPLRLDRHPAPLWPHLHRHTGGHQRPSHV